MEQTPVDHDLIHLHPMLAVVGDPPLLVHLAEGWEDELPTPELARALGMFALTSTVERTVKLCAESDDAEALRSQLDDLRSRRVLLDGPSPTGPGGLFSVERTTVAGALAQPAADAVVIGMPYDVATTVRAGSRAAPEAVRAASGGALALAGTQGAWDPVLGRQVLAGRTIVDSGDIDAPVHHQNGSTVDQLRSTVRWAVASGALPVVIGGDHSIAFAVTEGCGRALGAHTVVQLDAHTDRGGGGGPWRQTLHHGNVGDHLAASTTVRHLVQAGVRQRTPVPPPTDEKVTVIPVDRTDPAAVLAAIPDGFPVHLSVDVDVLDPSVVSGTGTPVPGGLSLAQVVDIIDAVASVHQIVAIDCCELIPDHDLPGTLAVAEILARALIAVLDR